jgi:hypothetical protein
VTPLRTRLAIALCLLPTPVLADPGTLRLAEDLRALGRYDACAVEALRAAWTTPVESPHAFERAALCLSLAGRFGAARRLLDDPRARLPDGRLPAKSQLRRCLASALEPAAPLPASCTQTVGDDPDLRLAAYTPVLRALWQGDAQTARELALPQETSATTLATWQHEDQRFLSLHAHLPHPSPWIAGSLSALVPGLGRVYVGRWQDGLMSLALTATPGYFAIGGFERDGLQSVRGWLLGTTAAVFYLANVYGSAVGAGIETRRHEQAWLEEVRRALAARVDPP